MRSLSIVPTEEPRRLSIRLVTKRLEESPLYQRRTYEAAQTHVLAQQAAVWYLSRTFEPRWQS